MKTRLPKGIIAFKNADKAFHENWTPGRDPLNIPHPFRGVLLGPPNVGKSTIAKNLLLHQDPPFKELFCIHCDAEYTKEWEDVDAKMLSKIPTPEEFEGKVKTLVIIDDLEVKLLSKDQKRALDRLFGFVSTHKNISVILTSQDPFNVPALVRRCSNLWVLWKPTDLDSLKTVARRVSMPSHDMIEIFKNVMPEIYDSLWIDLTKKSPYPLRKNGTLELAKH